MVVLYIDLVQMPMQESRLWSNPYDYLILLHVTLHVILPAWSISLISAVLLQPTCFLCLPYWGIPHISGFCPNSKKGGIPASKIACPIELVSC